VKSVLVCAGDASGDQHAADWVAVMRQRRPGLRFVGLGGEAMQRAGVELLVHQRELAIGGLLEVVRGGARVWGAWRRMGAALDELDPDLVVLVDSGGFNIPFARRVRRRSRARVLYYVAPQVWVWRPGRIRKLAARVDRLALIWPFEVPLYRGSGLAADFVGHPLVEKLEALAKGLDRPGARARLGLRAEGRLVALMPGSRRNEIERQLPLQLETARALARREPDTAFALPLASCIERQQVEASIRRAGLPPDLCIDIVEGAAHELLRAADVVLTKPGTATVEAMLLGCPMVVMGRMSAPSAALLRRVLRVPWFAMPNLIAGRGFVPEFLQQEARPDAMARALADLMRGPERDRQLARLAETARMLGSGGAAGATADIAEVLLDGARHEARPSRRTRERHERRDRNKRRDRNEPHERNEE